jgi:cyclopropane fatty-acyl-phospholipid synthase-like methyltransferase
MDPEEHARIVRDGYDRIAEAYYRERDIFEDEVQIEEFISHLPENGVVLDIGCGGGVPVLSMLAHSRWLAVHSISSWASARIHDVHRAVDACLHIADCSNCCHFSLDWWDLEE